MNEKYKLIKSFTQYDFGIRYTIKIILNNIFDYNISIQNISNTNSHQNVPRIIYTDLNESQ